MATIVHTKSSTWKAMVRLQGWPPEIKTFRLKQNAVDWARNTEDEMVRGVYIKRASPTSFKVADAVDRYLKEITPTKAPSTQEAEIRRAAIVKRALGKYAMSTITPDIVREFMTDRLAGTDRKDENGKPIPADKAKRRAPDTVRLDLAFLGSLFQVAIEEWKAGLPFNPVKSVRRPRPVERVRRLGPAEEEKLFKALDEYSNPMLGWIVRIAIETAMRETEIVTLEIDQFDPKKRTITLPATKNGESRTVPLSQIATQLFAQAVVNPARPTGVTLVFPGQPGRDGKIRPYQFLSCWRTLKIRAGIIDYRFHDNRHEGTSRLVERGLSDQAVSAITGHKDPHSLRRYSHLRNQRLVGMLDRSERQEKGLAQRKSRVARRRNKDVSSRLQKKGRRRIARSAR